MSQERAYYFGCTRSIDGRREGGHYMYGPDLHETRWDVQDNNPWGVGVDGGLAPRLGRGRRSGEAPLGHAALHHKDGWTALSMWDRTGDSRGNSSSTFLFESTLTFDEALAMARELFGPVVARIEAAYPILAVAGEESRHA